jgi:hypothetical protein
MAYALRTLRTTPFLRAAAAAGLGGRVLLRHLSRFAAFLLLRASPRFRHAPFSRMRACCSRRTGWMFILLQHARQTDGMDVTLLSALCLSSVRHHTALRAPIFTFCLPASASCCLAFALSSCGALSCY